MAKASLGKGLLLLRGQDLRCACREGAKRRWRLQPLFSRYRFYSTSTTLDDINKAVVDEIIRVDHAGEYGAVCIYAGQMAVLGRTSVGPIIRHMADQEKVHLEKMKELMLTYRARPSALMPVWNIAGFMLGATTALLGKEAAMLCTVAVEEVISHHYNDQIRTLIEEDPEKYKELLEILKKFRDEEIDHLNTGLEHDAELVPGYSVLKNTIMFGCKAAIFLAKRI